MKVIVPVAGAGTRLRPHTFSTPKPLLSVGGKPVIGHILEPILSLPLDEVVFVLGSMSNRIQDYIDSQYSFKARYVEQKELLGLGYALHLAMSEVQSGPVLIILGDTIVRCDFRKFVGIGENVLGVHTVEDPQRFGIAEIRDGKIVALEEKPQNPKTNTALVGLYYFSDVAMLASELGQLVKSGKTTSGEIQLTDALQRMIARGASFTAHEVTGWLDCGKRETLLSTNQVLLDGAPTPHGFDSCTFISPVHIGKAASLHNAVIGPNVSIESGAHVSNSTIKNSIIEKNTVIENSRIEDSLVGPGVIVRNFTGTLNIGESSEICGADTGS